MYVYATTDCESQAAGIATRLLDEGRDATTRDVSDLIAEGYPIRSSFRYAVLVAPIEDDHSASRRVDVLRREAPHLLAEPADEPSPRRRVSAEIGDRLVIDGRSFILDARMSSDPLGVGRDDGDYYILRVLS